MGAGKSKAKTKSKDESTEKDLQKSSSKKNAIVPENHSNDRPPSASHSGDGDKSETPLAEPENKEILSEEKPSARDSAEKRATSAEDKAEHVVSPLPPEEPEEIVAVTDINQQFQACLKMFTNLENMDATSKITLQDLKENDETGVPGVLKLLLFASTSEVGQDKFAEIMTKLDDLQEERDIFEFIYQLAHQAKNRHGGFAKTILGTSEELEEPVLGTLDEFIHFCKESETIRQAIATI